MFYMSQSECKLKKTVEKVSRSHQLIGVINRTHMLELVSLISIASLRVARESIVEKEA